MNIGSGSTIVLAHARWESRCDTPSPNCSAVARMHDTQTGVLFRCYASGSHIGFLIVDHESPGITSRDYGKLPCSCAVV